MNDQTFEPSQGELIRLHILTGTAEKLTTVEEKLAVEQPYKIFLNGKMLWNGTMSPGEERELVIGHLYSEGLISKLEDVEGMTFKSNQASVTVRPYECRLEPIQRWKDEACMLTSYVDMLPGLMERMRAEQRIFSETGSTHCAAVFDRKGQMLVIAEDVARQNALDKTLGKAILANTVHEACIMTLTSRLSAQLVRKASYSGIRLLAGVSAATSQAVQLAYELGIALAGRVRGDSMQLYFPY